MGLKILLHKDDLVDCLLLLVAEFGRTTTRDALVSGLPVDGRLTPDLFARAADRIGFSARVVDTPVTAINAALMPAILLLEDRSSCLIYGVDKDAGTASVVFPELGSTDQRIDVPLAELEPRYLGQTIYCRPTFRPQDRAGNQPEEAGHWFWSVISGNRRIYRDVLLAALFINLFAMTMPLFVMNVYDRVVPNHAIETLWVLALGVTLVLIGDMVLRHMRAWFIDVGAARADTLLSARIMERILGMRLEQRPASVGSYAANVQAFESVRSFIGSITVLTLVDLPFFVLFLLIIGLISAWLALPLLIGAGIALLYAMSISGRMRVISDELSKASSQRNGALVEGLFALETLKSFGATGRVQKVWEQTTDFVTAQVARQRLLGNSVGIVTGLLQQLVGALFIIIGVYLVVNGQISQGGMIAAYMLSSRAMAPVAQVSSLMTSYYQARTALGQLEATFTQPQERPANRNWISRPTINGDVEFRDVSFSYPGVEAKALRNVSFRIHAGERVAIIGRVGSGKSTIGRLILGLYQPTEGGILIDGVHHNQIDPDELRRRTGYIAQDPMLLVGTVLDNILLGAPHERRNENLAEAIEISGLKPMLGANAEGLEMQVGEGGGRLSGGQRQALSVARAVAVNAPLLVFDEPTSSMDASLEAHVTAGLRDYVIGRSLILITHKPALLSLVDRIIVMDDGRIVADGPSASVLEALNGGNIRKVAV